MPHARVWAEVPPEERVTEADIDADVDAWLGPGPHLKRGWQPVHAERWRVVEKQTLSNPPCGAALPWRPRMPLRRIAYRRGGSGKWRPCRSGGPLWEGWCKHHRHLKPIGRWPF